MGLEIPTLVIGVKVAGERVLDGTPPIPLSGEVVRIFSDAVVVEFEDGGRLYVPSTEFDRWEVVSRPRYTLETERGYL